jgi:hypothetical protein
MSIDKEKGPGTKTPVEAQNCFTTKDTKSTKESEDEALDPALKFGDIAQLITRFDSSSNSNLRVLRGKFSLASVPCKPKLEVGAVREPPLHSKRQET